MSQLGETLRSLRERGGIGQEQLAVEIGVRQQTVSRWEHGAALPRPSRIVQLARVLRADAGELHRLAGYLPDERGETPAELRRMRAWVADLDQQSLVMLVHTAWTELQSRDADEQAG